MTYPVAKSKTQRRDAVNDARKALGRWANLMRPAASTSSDTDPSAQVARVRALLWAQAHLERALYLETRGALGDLYATPGRIVARNGADQAVV